MSPSINDPYYAAEDQRFLGEEGFGEEVSREIRRKRTAEKRPDRSALQGNCPAIVDSA